MQNTFIKNRTNSPAWLGRLRSGLQHGDRLWQVLIGGMGLLVLAIMVSIAWLLWRESAPAQAQLGLKFFLPSSDTSWDPVNGQFQAWPFIYGTLITSLLALVVALPVSLGIAVFLAELCPAWLRTPLGTLVELLAAIPSVVFGLWGIFVFLPAVVAPLGEALGGGLGSVPGINIFFSGIMSGSGSSRLAAGLVLAIMIIPTIAAVSRDVLLAIPRSQREAAFALGATPWETIWQVLVPYGLSGILGAVILGLGRALGETMAVTMVIGNSADSSLSLLRPGYTMSSVIANEFAEAVNPLHSQALIEVALALFVMTLLLNGAARWMVWRVARRMPGGGRA
jgi:phosphate transport system permease protein